MKCIILCAGYATRLYPLTLDQPKPLLPVKGKPMLNYAIDKLELIKEIDEIFIITNDKFYNSFLEWSKNLATNKKIKIINDNTKSNEDRLGGLRDLWLVIQQENIKEDLFVIAGDNFFDFNLNGFVNFFKEKNKNTIGLYDIKDISKASNFGILEINKDNEIISFEEKPEHPKSDLVAVPFYIYPKQVVPLIKEYLDNGGKADAPGDFVAWLYKKEPVYAYNIKGKVMDIGNPESLERARKTFTI